MKRYIIIYAIFIISSCHNSNNDVINKDTKDILASTNTPPVATNVTISGKPIVDSKLKGTYLFKDKDLDAEKGTTFQWYTAKDISGKEKKPIVGATSDTYILRVQELNKYIGFEVIPHDGSSAGERKLSLFLGPVIQENVGLLKGQKLIAFLRSKYAPPSLADDKYDYGEARDLMYSKIWLQNTNQLTGIYSGYTITMDLTQDPSSYAHTNKINTEHIYPRSKGARREPMKSDMHSLAPSRDEVNAARSNLPFADISDSQATKWYKNEKDYSSDPDGVNSDSEEYSKKNSTLFEPRDHIKGDIARAIMYFYTMYDEADKPFFDRMKSTLLKWNKLDPVDNFERSRNKLIKKYQGNENPYIVDKTFAERAFSN